MNIVLYHTFRVVPVNIYESMKKAHNTLKKKKVEEKKRKKQKNVKKNKIQLKK